MSAAVYIIGFVGILILVGIITSICHLASQFRDSGSLVVTASLPASSFTMSEGIYYPLKFATDQAVVTSSRTTTNSSKFNVTGANGVGVTTLAYTAAGATQLTGQVSGNVLITADTNNITIICAVGVSANPKTLVAPTVLNTITQTLTSSSTFSGYFNFTIPFSFHVASKQTVAIIPMILANQPNTTFSAISVGISATEN